MPAGTVFPVFFDTIVPDPALTVAIDTSLQLVGKVPQIARHS